MLQLLPGHQSHKPPPTGRGLGFAGRGARRFRGQLSLTKHHPLTHSTPHPSAWARFQRAEPFAGGPWGTGSRMARTRGASSGRTSSPSAPATWTAKMRGSSPRSGFSSGLSQVRSFWVLPRFCVGGLACLAGQVWATRDCIGGGGAAGSGWLKVSVKVAYSFVRLCLTAADVLWRQPTRGRD